MDIIKNNLLAVLQALNSISVSGKANLSNLSGCIAVLEQVVNSLDEGKNSAAEE